MTSSVLVFASYYMEGEGNLIYFLLMLIVFVGSIFFLNFSRRGFAILVSWDVLGISSFFLVLFYNNWDSCRGAINTVLTNRVGDYFLFIFFGVIVFSSLGFVFLELFFLLGSLLLIVAGFTKSAQFPFSGWLPKAISAPTPVRALVHRRTLVTAGLILIMNFRAILLRFYWSLLVLGGGLLTILFSSITALVEEDIKKVVALSTLSQMGFAALTVGLGLNFIRLVHLLRHALFKSCLFIQVGIFIHRSFSQQDGRGYTGLRGSPFYIQLHIIVTLFCLCGLLFRRGAVSKDYILEIFFSNWGSVLLSCIFFVTVFLTFGYRYRLWKSLFLNFSKSITHAAGSVLSCVFRVVLIVLSILFL